MRLAAATEAHARSIAEVYRQAFPESVQLFFPRKRPERLLRLLELSFALVFAAGAQGIVALDESGDLSGYCLYDSAEGQARPDVSKAFLLLAQMGLMVGPCELLRLLANEFLMLTTARRDKKVPRPQATIVSVAVLPACQGKGVGTLLLSQVLDLLKGQSVGLNVREDNTAARHLYASAGFVECGSRRDLSGRWLILRRPPVS